MNDLTPAEQAVIDVEMEARDAGNYPHVSSPDEFDIEVAKAIVRKVAPLIAAEVLRDIASGILPGRAEVDHLLAADPSLEVALLTDIASRAAAIEEAGR
jgi:hypothetical protein